MFNTELIITGHSSGQIKIWKVVFKDTNEPRTEHTTQLSTVVTSVGGKWDIDLIDTHQQTKDVPITCLYFPISMRYLLSGDEKGQVYGWMY
jgi:hypothetical protein